MNITNIMSLMLAIDQHEMFSLNLPAQCISESCSKIKINLKFLFQHFFVVPVKVLWGP